VSAVGTRPPDPTTGSLAERAYYALRHRLLTLVIPPGGLIQEDRLCAELGLGRTPVREAIKRLEAEHLVVVYPRRGTFATEMDIADHALIADVRRHLEALAAERAAEQMTRSDEAGLRSLRRDIDAIDSIDSIDPAQRDALMLLDGRLHQAIYKATHNAYLETTLAQYYNLALRLWYVFIERLEDVHGHVEGHAGLVDAILARDGATARALAARHVEDFERAVLEVELQTIPLTPGRP
jgi:DNA-binding GntR family transcriptional regulator